MKYLEKRFSVPIQVNITQSEWDRIFKKEKNMKKKFVVEFEIDRQTMNFDESDWQRLENEARRVQENSECGLVLTSAIYYQNGKKIIIVEK